MRLRSHWTGLIPVFSHWCCSIYNGQTKQYVVRKGLFCILCYSPNPQQQSHAVSVSSRLAQFWKIKKVCRLAQWMWEQQLYSSFTIFLSKQSARRDDLPPELPNLAFTEFRWLLTRSCSATLPQVILYLPRLLSPSLVKGWSPGWLNNKYHFLIECVIVVQQWKE